jgi:two-component system NtrC family sensor kinase
MLVGKKCYEQLYNRSDPCPACRVMETITSANITSRFSREWLDPDKFIEWEITTFPIQEKNNLPHQVIIFEEDVTEKRNLEANLIQSEKLAAVGQLAAGVAHEINNPLAAIIANAQILLREMRNGDPDTLDAIRLIETAGIRASQVVSNLLSIARKEKKYEFELLSLNETITGALSLVHHEVVNHSIEILTDLQEEMPEIVASKNHIQGVWINMIVNSIDAIDKENGRITISSRYVDHEFRIVITDNGKGIPEDQLTRIFEPFYTTKVAGKGTGLGLSVCLRVIKEHQGSIQVESQAGKGSRFTIILPDLARSSTGRTF